jgi:WD40 repeat protein
LTSLAIAPDHQTVATAMGNLSNDWGQVTVWNASTGKQVARYRGPPYLGEVFSLSFSGDGKVVSITSGPAGGR